MVALEAHCTRLHDSFVFSVVDKALGHFKSEADVHFVTILSDSCQQEDRVLPHSSFP